MRVTTQVLAPAAYRGLVSLATVKDELGIDASDSSQNARLARYIAQATADIEQACQRVFAVETVADTFYFDGCDCGTRDLVLSRSPIVNVATLTTRADAISGATVLSFDLGGGGPADIVPISYIAVSPAADTPILRHTLAGAAQFAANLPGSILTAGFAPTADITFEIAVNDMVFATATILAGQTAATFAGVSASAIAGDVLTVTPLAGSAASGYLADPTLAMISGYVLTGDPGPAMAYPGIVPVSYIAAPPATDTPILMHTLSAPVRFKADLPGSVLTAGIAATGAVVFDIALNGLAFATATIAASGTEAVISGIETRAEANDVLTITPRAGTAASDLMADETLAMMSGYIIGSAAVDIPAAGQPVSGTGIAPGTLVVSVAGNDVTLSLPTLAAIPTGSDITFGFALYTVGSGGTRAGLGYAVDYILDAEGGRLIRASSGSPGAYWGSLRTVAVYAAGYDPIPADLQAECLRHVMMLHAGHGRDPLLKARDGPTYGREEFWVNQLPRPFAGKLNPYIRSIGF